VSAALYALYDDRPPVAQKHKGHPPRGVVCLAKVRRQQWEQAAAERRRAEQLQSLRETLQSVHSARIRAMSDMAQPDSVIAARVRERAAEAIAAFNEQIADCERRLRDL
jgi:hypothetical protein